MGFEPIISVLKLRGITYKFTQQKVRSSSASLILDLILPACASLLIYVLLNEQNPLVDC